MVAPIICAILLKEIQVLFLRWRAVIMDLKCINLRHTNRMLSARVPIACDNHECWRYRTLTKAQAEAYSGKAREALWCAEAGFHASPHNAINHIRRCQSREDLWLGAYIMQSMNLAMLRRESI